jgi:hypothetical protein
MQYLSFNKKLRWTNLWYYSITGESFDSTKIDFPWSIADWTFGSKGILHNNWP